MRSVQRGITTTFIILIILGTAIALVFVYFTSFEYQKQKAIQINTFEDCAKHYPVMESYPEQCSTPDGKHFTRSLSDSEKHNLTPPAQPSAPQEISWVNYQDEELSLIYPNAFEVHKKESDVIRQPTTFSNSQMDKFIAFYAPQSDNGFFFQFWTNDKNLSVPEWWKDQFVSSGKNSVYGVEQKVSSLIAQPKRIGQYDLYQVDNQGPESFQLFRFKDSIILFVSSRFEEDNEKILRSLK